MMFSAR